MFLKRSYQKEIMDDFSIQDSRIDKALSELKIVNKLLGGITTSKEGLKLLIEKNSFLTERTSLNVLDIGAGASDILTVLNKKLVNLKIFSLDLNKRACLYLKQNRNIKIICGDTTRLPFKPEIFEIVHASLFFHHFNETEVTKILLTLKELAGEGIIINDLRRSLIAYWLIKIIGGLFSKSYMVKNDAPLSVKRGFVKSDLIKILNDAGFENYKIKESGRSDGCL